MDISNALVTTIVGRRFQDSRQAQPDVVQRAPVPERRAVTQNEEIDAEEITQRGTELAESRVQRLDNLASASLKTRQALDAYQQTVTSTQAFDQGELVGVDLFV